ncbi:MAG: hypothetical protein EHM58_13755 [Ignavibacteriae bacterium]|nr:MAG: hypothetical protein EHM58_13755 [Ignavibacteriota bacterium]
MITITKQTKPIILRKASKRLCEVTAEPAMIERLAGYGLNEKEIANILDITAIQFYKAIRKYRTIKDAIERGRKKVSASVVESLYKRATGFFNDTIIYTKHKGVAAAHPATKYYPPDIKAIAFWLKNRMPMEWRDKIDPEKGTYLIDEETFKFLTDITVKRMQEMT